MLKGHIAIVNRSAFDYDKMERSKVSTYDPLLFKFLRIKSHNTYILSLKKNNYGTSRFE